MISSFLVEELKNLSRQSPEMILAYYFCDDKHQDRRTATAILRGLLLQILRQRPILFKHIQDPFEMSRDSLFSNFHALWRVFISIVQDPDADNICCLIDALDECENVSRQLFLTDFVRLFHTQQSPKAFVKFIITSRRQNDIDESLSQINPRMRNLQIDSGRVNHDLEKFINVKVDELSTMKGYKSGLKEKIRSALIDKAGGTFLYVSLVLHDLQKTKLASQATQKLKDLPADLNKVYDKILTLIDGDCKEIAIFVLRWVAVARRPLTVDELAMVCALDSKEHEDNKLPREGLLDEFRDVYKCCEPLVYVDTGNDVINLVHQSAKDYLLGSYLQANVELSHFHIVQGKTNLLIFGTCWRYLTLDEFEPDTHRKQNGSQLYWWHEDDLSETYTDYCFLKYVRYEWLKHALAAETAVTTGDDFWERNLEKLPEVRDYLLTKTAAGGQAVMVQWLLDGGAEPNYFDIYGDTALCHAATHGHEAIVRLFLSRKDVEINPLDYLSRTPLAIAATFGHEAVVRLLLSREDVKADSRDTQGRTAFSRAAEEGHESVVKLLLSREDVKADSLDDMGQTPLSRAAEEGHEAVVKLLLSRRDVAPDTRDQYGRTPLDWAVENGHKAVVRLLEQEMEDVSLIRITNILTLWMNGTNTLQRQEQEQNRKRKRSDQSP